MLDFLLAFLTETTTTPPTQQRQLRVVNTPGGYYSSKTPLTEDLFGKAVAISGDGLVAVAGGSPDGTLGNGRVSVYAFIESTWTYCQDLVPNITTQGSKYGNALSISVDGSYIFVGAHEDNTFGQGTGAVHVFSKLNQNSNTWVEEAKLLPSSGEPGLHFGYSLSSSSDGGKVIISNYPRVYSNTVKQPTVSVYTKWQGNWGEEAVLGQDIPGLLEKDFGAVLSLSADGLTAIVSASCDDNQKGAVYIFRSVGNIWTMAQKLVPSTGYLVDKWFSSGCAISPDGNTIAATTIDNLVYIFKKLNDVFTEDAVLATGNSSVQTQGVHCVAPVALSWDGNTILVGDPGDNSDSIEVYGGAAYFYVKTPEGWFKSIKNTTWTQTANDRLGSSVSISYDGGFSGQFRYLVGAPSKETPGFFEIFHADLN